MHAPVNPLGVAPKGAPHVWLTKILPAQSNVRSKVRSNIRSNVRSTPSPAASTGAAYLGKLAEPASPTTRHRLYNIPYHLRMEFLIARPIESSLDSIESASGNFPSSIRSMLKIEPKEGDGRLHRDGRVQWHGMGAAWARISLSTCRACACVPRTFGPCDVRPRMSVLWNSRA